MTGEISNWNADKGYGFIRPDDGSNDVFVHASQLPDGKMALAKRTRVKFSIGPGKHPNTFQAENVSLLP